MSSLKLLLTARVTCRLLPCRDIHDGHAAGDDDVYEEDGDDNAADYDGDDDAGSGSKETPPYWSLSPSIQTSATHLKPISKWKRN